MDIFYELFHWRNNLLKALKSIIDAQKDAGLADDSVNNLIDRGYEAITTSSSKKQDKNRKKKKKKKINRHPLQDGTSKADAKEEALDNVIISIQNERLQLNDPMGTALHMTNALDWAVAVNKDDDLEKEMMLQRLKDRDCQRWLELTPISTSPSNDCFMEMADTLLPNSTTNGQSDKDSLTSPNNLWAHFPQLF